MQEDEIKEYMRMVIALANQNVSQGGGPFGALVVHKGRVIATGVNRVTANCDPTAHAEIMAIREAGRKLKTHILSECVLFTSCEPCPMCMSAIYWAHIPLVYYGNSQLDAHNIGFDDSLIYQQLALPMEKRAIIMTRVCAREALETFRRWTEKDDRQEY